MKKLFVIFFFSLFLSGAFGASQYYLLKVQPDFSSVPSKPFPGDVVSLVVNVENYVSDRPAYDVNAQLQLNDELFEVIDVLENLGTIKTNSAKQAAFRFRVKDGILPGLYRFPVELTYQNGSAAVTDYFDVNLLVNECFGLDVQNISYLPVTVYAGKPIAVSANVVNICSGVARQASVELKPVTNSSFDPFILLSSNVLELSNILPGESNPVSFVLQPVSNAGPQVYVFELEATCLDCKSPTTDKASFEVLGVPWVIISGTDFSIAARKDSKDLRQGDVFSFSVQLDNIGKEKAKAVKLRLQSDLGFAGSSEAFVGNIDPDDSGTGIFDLVVTPDAKVGSHEAKIFIEYFDETNSLKTVEESFDFYVNERPAESPVFLIILVIIMLVALYFVLRLVFRQLSLRKANLK